MPLLALSHHHPRRAEAQSKLTDVRPIFGGCFGGRLLSRAVYAVPRGTERIHRDGFWQRLAGCALDPMYRGVFRGGFWRKIKNALWRGTGLQASSDSLGWVEGRRCQNMTTILVPMPILKSRNGQFQPIKLYINVKVYVQGAAGTKKPHEVEIDPITTRIAIPSWKCVASSTRVGLAKSVAVSGFKEPH
ncbi:hypothetical protein K438DRAFT_1782525 [Mycena galopus ATCC 62051]|nr:hypothetical protein K438DRAFT_1782525 [Mycena galopus ATCC 62051]